jgi:hypothetical protein
MCTCGTCPGPAVQVPLDVGEVASLPEKIEALRVFLEERLGMEPFLQLYRCIEALPQDEATGEGGEEGEEAGGAAARPVGGELSALDTDTAKYVPLVQQLIAREEMLHAGIF